MTTWMVRACTVGAARATGAALALALSIGGCGRVEPTEGVAKEYCKRTEACALGVYEAEWSDLGDCVDEYLEVDEEVFEDCDVDEGEARDCAQAIRASSCEDFVEGDWLDDCEDTYDCDEGDLPVENPAVAACEAAELATECGGEFESLDLACHEYELVDCDVVPYFECLEAELVCESWGIDAFGWAACEAPEC